MLGRYFLSAVLATLMETDEIALEERLSGLARAHHLLSPLGEEELPDGTLAVHYRFAHALYQETLYEDLVPSRRQMLHRRAALALLKRQGERASRHAAALALHFERGRDFPPAIDHRVRAAEGAFLKKDGKPTSFAPQAHQEIGRIEMNLGRVGDVGGVSGSGTLAVITFRGKAKGSVNLGFENADFFAPGGEPLDADIYSAVTEVQ